MKKIEKVVNLLIKNNKTISTMESCTGGGLANVFTNVVGASEILKFCAVTYCNEFKIKMGVDKNIIDKYTVYSIETAKEMSKNISKFTNSSYGVGITGKLNSPDPNNMEGSYNAVYFSIYDKENDKYYNEIIKVTKNARSKNKTEVIDKVIDNLYSILK